MSDLPTAARPDTPVAQPPSRLDAAKAFVGDLARPFAIISTSAAASGATIIVAWRVTTFGEGALFIGAVFAGVGALFGVKGWEKRAETKAAAEVEIAKVQSGAAS